MLYDCLIKTKHFAIRYKIKVLSVISALCWLVNEFTLLTKISMVLKETPINGGLTYEGPKVAEYPGR